VQSKLPSGTNGRRKIRALSGDVATSVLFAPESQPGSLMLQWWGAGRF
jgi:hypothetical protein